MAQKNEDTEESYEATFDADGNVQTKAEPPVEVEEEEDEDQEPDTSVEVIDDTPDEDRDREPMPGELVEELEADELEEYSGAVKQRLKQLKKVWHDERRAKERALRESQEAVQTTNRMWNELQGMRQQYTQGEQHYMEMARQAAQARMDNAERNYREAHESGDTDEIIAAQRALSDAQHEVRQWGNVPAQQQTAAPLQAPAGDIQQAQQAPSEQRASVPKPDNKTMAWQERNEWFGSDSEMTATALGLHQKLFNDHGADYIGSDKYYADIDTTMRRRYPEFFGDDTPAARPARRKANGGSVVAPASRSRSTKKILLTQTQVNLARKLGVTPEQYAKEVLKLGSEA